MENENEKPTKNETGWLDRSLRVNNVSLLMSDIIFNSYSRIEQSKLILEIKEDVEKYPKVKDAINTHIKRLTEKLNLLKELIKNEPK